MGTTDQFLYFRQHIILPFWTADNNKNNKNNNDAQKLGKNGVEKGSEKSIQNHNIINIFKSHNLMYLRLI
jgi:hypothetical protein